MKKNYLLLPVPKIQGVLEKNFFPSVKSASSMSESGDRRTEDTEGDTAVCGREKQNAK